MTDPTPHINGRWLWDAKAARPARAPETVGLSEAQLAAYIDGRLAPTDRAEVEQAIAADPEAYAWLADAIAVARELPEDEVAASAPMAAPATTTPRRWWPLAVAGLATAATLAVVLRGTVAPTVSPDVLLAGLVADAGTPRFDPWLSGGFGVAAQATMRGDAAGRPSSAVLARLADLEQAASRAPSPAAAHALGVALLVAGGQSRAEAVGRLEAAAKADPQPAYLSDLAAAYLERAIRSGVAADAELALAQAQRALAVAPALPEALYNRALALQTLNRRQDAIDAWTAFLATPQGPGHAPARQHLDRLRARPESGNSP